MELQLGNLVWGRVVETRSRPVVHNPLTEDEDPPPSARMGSYPIRKAVLVVVSGTDGEGRNPWGRVVLEPFKTP